MIFKLIFECKKEPAINYMWKRQLDNSRGKTQKAQSRQEKQIIEKYEKKKTE